MPKPYLIRFWHGTPHDNTHFMKKCIGLFRRRDGDGTYFWDGTMQEFMDKWKDKFLYLPAGDSNSEYILGTICITQYGSFGQR